MPIARGCNRRVAIKREPEQLTNDMGMQLDPRCLLIGSRSSTVRGIKEVLHTFSHDANQHDFVFDGLRRNAPGE